MLSVLSYIVTVAVIHYVLFYQICPKMQYVWQLYLGKWKIIVSLVLGLFAPLSLIAVVGFMIWLLIEPYVKPQITGLINKYEQNKKS